MGDAQLELICYGSYPRVTLCLKHLLWASKIQITYRNRGKKQKTRVRKSSNEVGMKWKGYTFVKLESREREWEKIFGQHSDTGHSANVAHRSTQGA